MQHIALDIGDVIFHVNLNPFVDCLKSHGIEQADGFRFLYFYENAMNIGMHSLEDCLSLFFRDMEREVIQGLLEAWDKCVEPNEVMLNFVSNLKSNGVKIALLSNIGYDHARLLRAKYSDVLSGCIQHFSFEVGVSKPKSLYFQSFLLDHEDFAGCLYLDDRKENIKAASNRLDGVLFCLNDMEKPSDVKKALNKIIDRMKRG